MLRKQRTSIIAAYISPEDPRESWISDLFGQTVEGGKERFECNNRAAIGSALQVFSSELWANLSDAMTSQNNTGVHVFKDVKVHDKPELGITGYTLDNLIIIDNWNKDQFVLDVLEEGVNEGLLAEGHWPCNIGQQQTDAKGKKKDCSLEVPANVAVAMALLNQWKIAQNADVIASALSPN